jgi:hypothetical protein
MATTRTRVSVKSITVRLHARDGRQADVQLDPRKDDTLFLSLGAVDTFLVPVYAARDELDAALRFRAQAAREFRRTGAIVVLHKAGCMRKMARLRWRVPSTPR